MTTSASGSYDGNLEGYVSLFVTIRLPELCTGVLTYPHSPDYRPGIHGLTPVQVGSLSASLNTIV
jgi:hypothetical protein